MGRIVGRSRLRGIVLAGRGSALATLVVLALLLAGSAAAEGRVLWIAMTNAQKDSGIFDVLLLEPVPEGEPFPEPPEPIRLGIEQSYTEVEALGFLGPVYDEDTGNLDAQQKGFKTSGRGAGTLGNYQESRIRHVNATLDAFLEGDLGSE